MLQLYLFSSLEFDRFSPATANKNLYFFSRNSLIIKMS